MKKFILLTFLLLAQPVLGNVMISEVLYDPIGTENGGEAILLYNDNYEEIDVSGWVIATKASSRDAVLPLSTTIPGKEYLLIADSGFSLNKDNASWPDADYEEAITLSNSNAGVALMNENITIDAVGWGDPLAIGDDSLYEGMPHSGVVEGQSLVRVSNTNDNSVDFLARTPLFSTTPEYNPLEILIDLEVNISSNDPEIINIEILSDDNLSKNGTQINPIAGETRTFSVRVETFNPNNNSDYEMIIELFGEEFIIERVVFNNTNAFFEGNVSIEYFVAPGNYNLTTTIIRNDTNITRSTVFEYAELAVISAQGSLGFDVKPGEEKTDSVTITNLGNVPINLNIKGTSLSDGNKNLELGSISYSDDNFATSNELTSSFADIGTVLVNSNKELSFRISGSDDMEKGNYKGKVVLLGQT